MPLVFWHRSHIFIILFLHLSTPEVTNYCDTLENMFFLLLPVCAQPQMFVVISTRGKNPCNHHQLPLIPAVWLYLGLTIAAVICNNNINVPSSCVSCFWDEFFLRPPNEWNVEIPSVNLALLHCPHYSLTSYHQSYWDAFWILRQSSQAHLIFQVRHTLTKYTGNPSFKSQSGQFKFQCRTQQKQLQISQEAYWWQIQKRACVLQLRTYRS